MKMKNLNQELRKKRKVKVEKNQNLKNKNLNQMMMMMLKFYNEFLIIQCGFFLRNSIVFSKLVTTSPSKRIYRSYSNSSFEISS